MLKVIGAGFGRTGTLSMKHALEQLGFVRCYHMQEVMVRRPGHAKLWLARARGEPVDWHELFDGYQASVDFPACLYYRELMEAFPDAKVVLTVRDADRWYDSAAATIYPGSFLSWPFRLIPFMRDISDSVWLSLWNEGGLFDGKFEDRAATVARFHSWVEEVKAHVPPERLLVFEVKQGWEPLCRFLDVKVPDSPFPRVNDRKMAERGVRFVKAAPYFLLAGALLAVAAGVWAWVS